MSENSFYNKEWLEGRLDLFDAEKSSLFLDLHHKKQKSGLLSYILLGCAVLALAFAAIMAFAPNGIVRGLYDAGANVDIALTAIGAFAVACCGAAALFASGPVRFAAIGVSAAALLLGAFALIMIPQRLTPIEISNAEGLASVNRFRFGSYALSEDIELPEKGVEIKTFAGRLDGAGHSVTGGSGLHIKNNYGSVCDLAIDGVSVSGEKRAILCENNYGTVSGVSFGSGVEAACNECAPVFNNRGSIANCTSSARYACAKAAGGFAYNNYGVIENCEFAGTVEGLGAFGGMTYDMKKGSVRNCIARGSAVACREGSCGIACLLGSGRIEKCFVDMMVSEGAGYFYPVCSSAVTGGKGSVIQCYSVSNEAYVICGDSVIIPRDELCEARLTGLDFNKVWHFDEENVLRLTSLEEIPVAERPQEVKPTATPAPTATPEPESTPEPTATPEPTTDPKEIYGELAVYPAEEELFSQPGTGKIKGGHNANMRPGPGGGYSERLALIKSGEEISLLGKKDDSYFVEYNGVFGWVNEKLIKIVEEPVE